MQTKQKQENEDFKATMEAARFVSTHVWNAAGKSLKKNEFDPVKLLPFGWDKPKQKEVQSADEMKDFMFGIAKTQNKRVEKKEARKRKNQ